MMQEFWLNEFWHDFHLLRPLWLLMLLPLGLLLLLLKRNMNSNSLWSKVCDEHLLQHLLLKRGIGNSPLLLSLLSIGWIIAVIALAGPTWSKRPQPVFQVLDTRVIVLDLSRSMDAPDLKPSRAMRARFKVADILAQSEDGQVALVVFAGAAFVVSPITQDADTINNMLPALLPEIMPVAGSRPDLGLRKAHELLTQAEVSQGSIILITDESNGALAIAAAQDLQADGFSVSVLGIGTEQGAPIPTQEGDLLKDSDGNIVIPKLDQTALQNLAAAGGGHYASIRADNQDLQALFAAADDYFMALTEQADQEAEHWHEQGPWLVLLLLPIAALAFRRGWLVVLLLSLNFSLPPPALAWTWADFWLRRDQQFQQALDNNSPQRAGELATTAWQRGTAAYRAGDYQQAVNAFAELSGAQGHYNRGNALTQLQRYDEAIAAYESALQEQPGMEEAEFNRDIAEALQRQRQQQQPSSDQNQDPQQMSEQQRERQSDTQSQGGQGQPNAEQQQQVSQQPDQQGSEQSDPDPQESDQNQDGEQQQEQTMPQHSDEEADQETEQQELSQGDAEQLSEEQQQIMEQWLRRIPDDPAGLLRNKFRLQYQRLATKPDETKQTW